MHRLRRTAAWPVITLSLALVAFCGGCASPGPPRPPSLQLPAFVTTLTTVRSGPVVILHFSVPTHTTDGLLLRGRTVTGALCRQTGGTGPCTPVDAEETREEISVTSGTDAGSAVTWTDTLPEALRHGPPRAIGYRVALSNAAGRTAGYGDAVYAAAGAAPEPVLGFVAEGTRRGTALRWRSSTAPGEVIVERTGPTAPAQPPAAVAKTAPGRGERSRHAAQSEHTRKESGTRDTAIMEAAPEEGGTPNAMLDTTVAEDIPYTYIAVRRQQVQAGGRKLELRSEPAPPVSFTWRDVYPPPAPQGLDALGYEVPAGTKAGQTGAGYAVDLIWEPVNDPRLAGYRVYRQRLNEAGALEGERTRLTAEPVTTPGFHDDTAKPGERYRYSVTATDPKGNESGAAEATLQP